MASRAAAAPVMPPPMISRSNCSLRSRSSAAARVLKENSAMAWPLLRFFGDADDGHSELGELLGRDGGWRLGHQVRSLLGFREGHHVANRADSAKERGHAV